jgi:hypothetical protein
MSVKGVLRKKSFWLLGLPLLMLLLIIEASPLVAQKPAITGEVAKTARDNAKALADGLAASRSFIDLSFTEQDVVAISAATSHLFDNTNVAIGYSPSFLQLAATSKINVGVFSLYLNGRCEVAITQSNSRLDSCRLGDLPLPSWLVQPFINAGLWALFDTEVKDSVNNMIAGLQYNDRKLTLSANKSVDFRQRINRSLSNASSVAKAALSNDIPSPELIQLYLATLYQQNFSGGSLLLPIVQLAQLASVRSLENDPQTENAAMLWALAIRFGNQRFARIAKVEESKTQLGVKLRGREDLALHFLYSAILQQVGNDALSFNIGELKEVLDSGSGGSGFSFVDLAADKAGIAFAGRLTGAKDDAINAQSLLANAQQERVFFPFTHDLPEGFSETSFARIFTEIGSDQYQALEAMIAERIANLSIHGAKDIKTAPIAESVASISSGQWLKVDTHIHSKFSDGSFSVDDIAKQAAAFGCSAIAITDHGDRNLKGVLSEQYFNDIKAVNKRYNDMTVMAGLEWNVPPFNGREHATVLFAQAPSDLRALSQFRAAYDHYNDKQIRHLNIREAMTWLNEYAKTTSVKPVLIYNHPSRKDYSVDENFFDLSQWLSLSDAFIGLSGAPGHQAKRANDNGSYEGNIRTEHGWDPVASEVGGVWDELLRRGYRVLGARSDSDFHNLTMDYWPCQFSSTHIYSRSNAPDDVLNALRAGRSWAQQGNFIEQVELSVSAADAQSQMGERVQISVQQPVMVNIDVTLNVQDWQGYPTTLDALNLVIVDESGTRSVPVLTKATVKGRQYKLRLPLEVSGSIRAIRLQGRSIQSGLHHYQFMTNPIFFSEQQ